MLYKKTVERETFELLKSLMLDKELEKFNLAGGTSLALYLGHRVSIDLDLFTPEAFNARELEEHLVAKYNFKVDYSERSTLKGSINNVKVDCIAYKYPLLESVFIEDNIRLFSMPDIAAMKLFAITENGTRLKDFIDIACLSTKISLNDMLAAYEAKYPNANSIRPLRALTYYEDVNFNEPIKMLNGAFDWLMIKERLNEMLKNRTKVFKSFPIG